MKMSKLDHNSKLGFVGAGMVGKSLALALSKIGYSVVAVSSRSFSSACELAELVCGVTAYQTVQEVAECADIVFITVPDDAIESVASSVRWHTGQGTVHTSGVTSLDVLSTAAQQGACVGALHPLQTFSSIHDAVLSIPGSTFAIEGGGRIKTYLKEMTTNIGGTPIFLKSTDKALYHASVDMMGGLLTGFVALVADTWKHFGIEHEDAVRAIVPIIKGDAAALEAVGIPGALAGPYVRGDVGTIRKHLDAIGKIDHNLLAIYRQMALMTFPYAIDKGKLDKSVAAKIRSMLVSANSDV